MEHQGKTSSSFTYSQIMAINQQGTILIKYDPNTFDSVESSYQINKIETIIFYVLLFVDVAFIIANIVTFLITKNKEKIAISGKEYTAEFVAYKSNLSVNNLKLYNIVYTWVD